jgi:hypothetical protein
VCDCCSLGLVCPSTQMECVRYAGRGSQYRVSGIKCRSMSLYPGTRPRAQGVHVLGDLRRYRRVRAWRRIWFDFECRLSLPQCRLRRNREWCPSGFRPCAGRLWSLLGMGRLGSSEPLCPGFVSVPSFIPLVVVCFIPITIVCGAVCGMVLHGRKRHADRRLTFEGQIPTEYRTARGMI